MLRIGWIGLAVMVALGLLWSVAATSKLVPLPSAEISSASMRRGSRDIQSSHSEFRLRGLAFHQPRCPSVCVESFFGHRPPS